VQLFAAIGQLLAAGGNGLWFWIELLKVHLGHLARRGRRHAHRRARLLPKAGLTHVAPQRLVLDRQAPTIEQLLDAGEQQVVLVEPGGDLVVVRPSSKRSGRYLHAQRWPCCFVAHVGTQFGLTDEQPRQCLMAVVGHERSARKRVHARESPCLYDFRSRPCIDVRPPEPTDWAHSWSIQELRAQPAAGGRHVHPCYARSSGAKQVRRAGRHGPRPQRGHNGCAGVPELSGRRRPDHRRDHRREHVGH
jgi:hypothetical protein